MECASLKGGWWLQFELNDGEPIGVSIPATEHSVMTSWPSERDAILNMISHFGSGIFACVMDSYDYAKVTTHKGFQQVFFGVHVPLLFLSSSSWCDGGVHWPQALAEVVPSIAQAQIGAGGYMVLRPDSGDPVEAVIAALEAAEKVFGVDTNSKGYKVPRGCGVIQGDGIDLQKLSEILAAVLEKGFSAEVCTPVLPTSVISTIIGYSCIPAGPDCTHLCRLWLSAWVVDFCRRLTGTQCPLQPN